ncbi:MAG: hypothetical protein ACOVSW_15050 [Candidatus Kapaibacteriota bacterium]
MQPDYFILDEEPDIAVLSEQALAKDWLNNAEDEAWSGLQQEIPRIHSEQFSITPPQA